MSNKPRRDGDRRQSDRSDRADRGERRDQQPDDDQQRRPGEDTQESDSLTALKAILGKVATLLNSLKLTQDECTSLVEQLYGSVLDMDLKLAGETDDKRKSSVLAHIQNTKVTRAGGRLVVEFPKVETPKPAPAAAKAAPKTDSKPASAQAAPDTAAAPAPAQADQQPAAEPQTSATPEAAVEQAPAAPAEAAPDAASAESQEKLDVEG